MQRRVGVTADAPARLEQRADADEHEGREPVGQLGDRVGRSRIIVLGYTLYGLINLGLIFATSRWEITVAFAFYGFFYSIDESQSKAFIADLEPERRATAVGVYNFVTGMLYLPASLVAGALWTVSPGLALGLAAGLSLAAIVVFGFMRPTPFNASTPQSQPPSPVHRG